MKPLTSKRTSYEWGVLWMLLSATCLSLSFLFLQVNLKFIDYYFLLFLRFFIPLLCVAVTILVRREWQIFIIYEDVPLQLARCLCVLISQYGIAFYLTKNTLLNATLLLNASPLFIPLMEWIFMGHRPGKSTILGALLSFLGVILVLKPDSSLFSLMSGIGLFAALGQAGSQVLYGVRARKENLLSTQFFLFLFTSLFALAVFFLLGHLEIVKAHMKIPFVTIFAMGLATLFNQYFRGLAYRCGGPSTLATFLYFSVFVSALFDWLIFHKTPTAQTIIGSCLIVLGGVVKVFLRAHILKKRGKK